MTDIIFAIVALFLLGLALFIGYEVVTALGAWIMNIIDLSN